MGPKPATSWSTPSMSRWRSSRDTLRPCVEEVADEVVDDARELVADARRIGQIEPRRKRIDDLDLDTAANLEERASSRADSRGAGGWPPSTGTATHGRPGVPGTPGATVPCGVAVA